MTDIPGRGLGEGQGLSERTATLEEQGRNLQTSLARIEGKLDRVIAGD